MYLSNSVASCSEIVDLSIRRCPRSYGDQARSLRVSRALLNPDIVRLTGSAAEYQTWVKNQPCSITRCESDNEFVQVRKPFSSHDSKYLGVSMSESVMHIYLEHGLKVTLRYYGVINQHQSDESTQAWLQQTAMELLHEWVWQSLKSKLGFQHWNEVPPQVFKDWAQNHKIIYALPIAYRNCEPCQPR